MAEEQFIIKNCGRCKHSEFDEKSKRLQCRIIMDNFFEIHDAVVRQETICLFDPMKFEERK